MTKKLDGKDLPVLIERWNNFMVNTEIYHQELSQKTEAIALELRTSNSVIALESKATNLRFTDALYKINESILKLPCPARQEITRGIFEQLRLVWIFIVGIVFAVIGTWFKK